MLQLIRFEFIFFYQSFQILDLFKTKFAVFFYERHP